MSSKHIDYDSDGVPAGYWSRDESDCSDGSDEAHPGPGERKARRGAKKAHVNSMSIKALTHSITSMEAEMGARGIPVTYPDHNHDHTPMIGHAKGNTSSNRRVIKKHQLRVLSRVAQHLEHILRESRK